MSKDSLQKDNSDELYAKVKAQVMVRDDSKGGWVPLGVGGMSSVGLIRFSKSDSTCSDLCIQGCRISDRTVILRCVIRKDLQYTKVNPTFHHWRTDSGKFGLTFQTSTDAKTFEKDLKKALNFLKQGCNERMSNLRIDRTQTHSNNLEVCGSFSKASSITASSPILTSSSDKPQFFNDPSFHRLSTPVPPSTAYDNSLYQLNSRSGQLKQHVQQPTQTHYYVHRNYKKPKTPMENLKNFFNVNIINKNENNNSTKNINANSIANLPKPWCYFTFPSFNLRSKHDSVARITRCSLPDNIKILTSNNDLKNSKKPLLLPPQMHKEMRHSVSGTEYICKKTPLLTHQNRPCSYHSSTSSKRKFEIFGRMTSKLMTFSSVSCPNESCCCAEDQNRNTDRLPSKPNPPSSSLPAMAGWSINEKKHAHYPSTLAFPFPNFPPPLLLQPSSSSSSNKNYGTIFSESEFALRLSCDAGVRERCKYCNEEFSSIYNFPNSCQQAPDRVANCIEKISCCFLARPLAHYCLSIDRSDPSYKRQESSDGSSNDDAERCESNKWALRTAFFCFSFALPCLCLYWPLTVCHVAAVECGCCKWMTGGRHQAI